MGNHIYILMVMYVLKNIGLPLGKELNPSLFPQQSNIDQKLYCKNNVFVN